MSIDSNDFCVVIGQLMQALQDLPSLEKMEHEQDVYGITYGE